MTHSGSSIQRLVCIFCGVLLPALLLASVADAKTRTVRGGVVGDADAQVTVRIAINKKGNPTKVKLFRVLRLDHACTDGVAREFDVTYKAKLRVRKLGLTPRYTFFGFSLTPSGRPAPNSLFVTGKLKRKANKVHGEIGSSIRFPSSQPSGETFCGGGPGPATTSGNVRYTAK